jgi:hypothetical protein
MAMALKASASARWVGLVGVLSALACGRAGDRTNERLDLASSRARPEANVPEAPPEAEPGPGPDVPVSEDPPPDEIPSGIPGADLPDDLGVQDVQLLAAITALSATSPALAPLLTDGQIDREVFTSHYQEIACAVEGPRNLPSRCP